MAEFQHRYGLKFTTQLSDLHLEQWCFLRNWTPEKGGLGRYRHFRNIASVICPKVQWNKNLEAFARVFCDDYYAIKVGDTIHRHITVFGCAASGKTFSAGFCAFVWWACQPEVSAVIHTSTSVPMLRKRVWPVVQDMYFGCPIPPGNLVDSKTQLQARKGDEKHGIFAIAVEDGDVHKAVTKIQGVHCPRICVIVDEATDVPEAIVKACLNLKKACQDFVLIIQGNPWNWTDQLGAAGVPKNGINSVSVEDEEWLTKDGICIHFRGSTSPNVKAGKTVYPYLYTYEDHIMDSRSENKDTIDYWRTVEGFPAPEGISNTVMSASLIEKHNGRGNYTFLSQSTPVCGLDPGFGGDRCIFRFGKIGDTTENKNLVLQLTETVEFKPKANDKDPVDYQIAAFAIRECNARGVKPEEFGVDATGTGRGIYAILCAEWSNSIHKVEFGGLPSMTPYSEADPRPSKEVFDRRASELQFLARELLTSGQMRGLSAEECDQFCKRQYTHRNKKVSVETKDDYKKRCTKSPDHADANTVLVDLVRQKGVIAVGKITHTSQKQVIEKANEYWQIMESEYSEVPDLVNETEVLFDSLA